jgi:hypothetical protein
VAAVDCQETNLANDAAVNSIDGDSTTIWHTTWNSNLALPHFITIDMGAPRWIGGFTYTPRQDGSLNGVVSLYRFETSSDGSVWRTNIDGGLFGNIRNNPARQDVAFSPVQARFFRFTALQEINTNGWTSAAELSVLPAGFDAWRRDLGLQTNSPAYVPPGSGVPLLADYFLGTTPGSMTVPKLVPMGAGGGWLQVSFRREQNLFDVAQNFQTSSNLFSWSPASGLVTNSVTPNPDGTETVQISFPKAATDISRFLRLLIADPAYP